jgi:hypothetical protein
MVSPLPEIVTVDQAVAHLNLQYGHYDEDDLALKIEMATALVLDHIWRDDDDWQATILAWTATTVPRAVQAAALVQLSELHRFRGDDPQGVAPLRQHGYLSPMVEAYLRKFRDPPVA